MKKNLTMAISALCILVLLIGAYVAVNIGFSTDSDRDFDDIFGTIEYLWDEKPANVKSVEYRIEAGNYTINVDDDITLDGYESIIMSRTELTKAVSKICMIPVKRFINVKENDIEKYGFENSKNVISLTMKDGKVHTLVLGSKVGVGNEVYALDKENSVVCTLSQEYYSEYTKAPSEYRSKVICTLSNVFVRELTVYNGKKKLMTIVSGETLEDYVMEYPYENAPVSKLKMNEFLSMFNQVDADAVVEENPEDISKYGFDNCLTVYIHDSAEKHTFKFGDLAPEGGMYMMYSDRPVVYRGTSFLYEMFKDVNPVDYLEPYVHSYNITDVSSVEMTYADKKYSMSLLGEGDKLSCKINTAPVDKNIYSALYHKISCIYYGDVAENAKAGNVYCTVIFTGKDGKQNKFVYYDYNRDYCVVRSAAGFDCMVLKSAIDEVASGFSEF